LGRHSILFGKNEFCVSCFDISQEAINRTEEWAKKAFGATEAVERRFVKQSVGHRTVDEVLAPLIERQKHASKD